jgi:hypothetical protein
VELVELTLELEVLDDELVLEALVVGAAALELDELAVWSASIKFFRSLLNCEIELGGGGERGGALDVLLAELTEEADVALLLDDEPAA